MPTTGSCSLYFHIPFCKRKCDYCHFYVIPEQERGKELLADGFGHEWDLILPFLQGKTIETVYFGGGTPSLFGEKRIGEVIGRIKDTAKLHSHAEITLEANPENITKELMLAYKEAGINRVSIGVQTLDQKLLSILGRGHSPETALKAIHLTFAAGIENISIDLMYDLPYQTIEHWKSTLSLVKTLPIAHLSLYNLTIEPHTLFFKKEELLRRHLPTDLESLKMYEEAVNALEEIGLQRYEISAFSKKGYESKHNTGYWVGRPFLGLGPSAFSYWEGERFRNVSHLGRYCQMLQEKQLPRDFKEKLDSQAALRELFVIRLRLVQGVDIDEFSHSFGRLDSATQKAIERLIAEGFIWQSNKTVALTKRGILFYDSVAAELI